MSRTSAVSLATAVCSIGFLLGTTPVSAQGSVPDTLETAGPARLRIQQMLTEEVLGQRKAWQALETRIHGALPKQRLDPARPHNTYGHCDLWVVFDTAKAKGVQFHGPPSFIRSRQPKYTDVAFCPNLSVSTSTKDPIVVEHEKAPPTPASLRPFSEPLIDQLTRAAKNYPDRAWFTDQLVRVLVENSDITRARIAANDCRTNDSWCRLLQFYVAQAAREFPLADSLLAGLSTNERITAGQSWSAAQALLDSADALLHAALQRDEQSRVDSVYWWLATPFLGESWHARRIAHVARLVRNQLNLGLPLEAHHDLRVERGADALLTMRVRYGFPMHHVWIGEKEDKSHFEQALGRRYDPPYSAMEYSRDNAAVAPSLALALDPFGMRDSSVLLSAPRDATADTWWPHEFFLHPRGRIVSLPARQQVLLRRDGAAVLYAATAVAGGELDSVSGSVRVVLAHSSGPAAKTQLVERPAQKGDRVVLRQTIQRPGLIGLEVLVDSGGLAGARSRVGLREVPTLGALGATTCTLSDPVLVQAAAPQDTADHFTGMLGSTDLVRPTSVGVAWESYGFPAGDSVTIAVRIASTDALSGMRRAGMALRLSDDPRVNVTMQWQEPNPARAGTTVKGSRPIVYRHVALDIRQLRRGAYEVEIEMTSSRCGTVSSSRALTVTR